MAPPLKGAVPDGSSHDIGGERRIGMSRRRAAMRVGISNNVTPDQIGTGVERYVSRVVRGRGAGTKSLGGKAFLITINRSSAIDGIRLHPKNGNGLAERD